jgi:4a-hydroxytetrahydrobiopterin dehydratase
MSAQTASQLAAKKCQPCEGGVDPVSPAEAQRQVEKLPGWRLADNDKSIHKEWVVKDFMTAIRFFSDIARLAEGDDHHPDLHLTGYRNVAVELSTHALGGLSENDFILAAKIDQIPVELKKKGQ